LTITTEKKGQRAGRRLWAGVLLVLLAGFLLAPWPLLDKLWAVGYGICPQRVSHSYFLAGQQLPVEARMVGMFAGFLLSVAVFAGLGRFRARRLPRLSLLLVLALFGASMAFDGVNNAFYDLGLPHLYAPYNPARLITGLMMGSAMAGILWPVFNMTVWRNAPDVPLLDRPWQLVVLLLVLGLFAAAILLGVDALLYPVSLLTTAGEIAILTTPGALLAAVALRRERPAASVWDLLPLLMAGLALAALLLGIMSALRYAASLTHVSRHGSAGPGCRISILHLALRAAVGASLPELSVGQ
jgi:uncharacterized membrane protein